ncbi:phage tail protein [Halogeometricum limi]|uniref:Phage tail protein domain-containing protein n=1 Tax=Halogeometricum limi TaxID=555875 RepID=A0A1I6IEX8_9EURY|nr:phage tail protein [Halogeometricum limi]SFR65189.1 phage tail protein domain-containing protein [Halogeometricum limi]
MTFTVLGTHTRAEWDEWSGENGERTDEGVVLARGRTPTYVDPVELGTAFGRLDAVDAAVDDCETVFVLTASGGVYRDDRTDGVLEAFVDPRTREDGEETGHAARELAVTADTVFVAFEDGTVTAVSRTTGASRWTQNALTDPVDATADHRYAYVLDRRPEGGVVFAFGREDGSARTLFADGDDPTAATTFPNPRGIARDDEGNLYVLYDESDGAGDGIPRFVVDRFDRDEDAPDGFALDPTTVSIPHAYDPVCVAVVGVDELLLALGPDAASPRTLVRYLPDAGRFEPVTTFEGACETLVLRRGEAGRGRGLYVLKRDDDSPSDPTILFFEEVRTNRRTSPTGGFEARLVRRFDAGEAGVQWHSVELGFTLAGAGTQVRLQYGATDDDVDTNAVHWRSARPNPRDTLLDDATGRYLWVSIDIVGTETASPTVSSCRVSLPRESYLRYLPAVYRENPDGAAFLERFLSVFESAFVEIEAEIADLTSLLDAEGIDADYLNWLESWLGLETDDSWTEENRRELLRRAPSLFRSRGTRGGLLEVLAIYLTGIEPPSEDEAAWNRARRRERELLDALVDEGVLGTDGRRRREESHATLPPDDRLSSLYLLEDVDLDCIDTEAAREPYRRLLPCPQCFVVLVAPYVDDEQVRGVDRIVRAERPAHAVGRGIHLSSRLELGTHSYLGVNSTLSGGTFALERATLGRDSTLVDSERQGVSSGN